MIRSQYSEDQLRLAARLYYLDGLGQAQIASFVKVSQAKVSRLLAMARERGIVKISVAEYNPRDIELEERVRERFGLKSVAVIKTMEGAGVEDTRRALGHFGAAYVSSLVPRDTVLAIAGGRTIREVVSMLPEDRERRPTIVQAMGSIDSNVGPVDALDVGRTMARVWGGFFLTLNTPAFVPDKRTRDSFLRLDQIRSVYARLDTAAVAAVGVGTPENSVFVERGVLKPEELKRLRQVGAVGEICGRFYNAKGIECETQWRDRVISIGLDRVRNVPGVIGVVAGSDRAEAIAAAIRGGLLKHLLIDQAGARSMLNIPTESRSR